MEQTIRLERRFAMIDEWLLDLDISDRAVRLYAVLSRYADNDTHKAYPSRDTLAKRLRCSTKSVDRAAQELVDFGVMTKQQRNNSSIIYTLRVVEGGGHQSPGGSTPVSRGVDTRVDLTIATGLEPSNVEPPNLKQVAKVSKSSDEFDQFWKVYPRGEDKPDARKAFAKALKRVSFDVLLAGAVAHRDDPNRDPQWTKYAHRWLDKDGWNNPLKPAPAVKARKMTNAEEGALLSQKYREEEQLALGEGNPVVAGQLEDDAFEWVGGNW